MHPGGFHARWRSRIPTGTFLDFVVQHHGKDCSDFDVTVIWCKLRNIAFGLVSLPSGNFLVVCRNADDLCNGGFSDLILLNNVKSTKAIDLIAMSKLGICSGLQNNGSRFLNLFTCFDLLTKA